MCTDEEFLKHTSGIAKSANTPEYLKWKNYGHEADEKFKEQMNRVIRVSMPKLYTDNEIIHMLCNALHDVHRAIDIPEFWKQHQDAVNYAKSHGNYNTRGK